MNNYDFSVGRLYHGYVFPYVGDHGDGAAANKFFPSPGDTDWAHGTLLQDYKDFFTLPHNERYYEKVIGPVHFFFLDTVSSEPDGVTQTSIQAEWLRAKLLLSTATWKVVVMFDSPHSSVSATAGMRWPFKAWGADMVLSGKVKNYERFDIAGLVVINNGLGGNPDIQPVVTPTTGSEFNYSAGFGAGKLTATETSLKYEFFDVDGTLIDTIELTK